MNDSENGSLWEYYIQALWDVKLRRWVKTSRAIYLAIQAQILYKIRIWEKGRNRRIDQKKMSNKELQNLDCSSNISRGAKN